MVWDMAQSQIISQITEDRALASTYYYYYSEVYSADGERKDGPSSPSPPSLSRLFLPR